MSRLYGRKEDVYRSSKLLVGTNLRSYRKDKTPITEQELHESPNVIEKYLPKNAIKFLEDNPITIILNPLSIREAFLLPVKEGEKPTVFFPRFFPIKEYQREFLFYTGALASVKSEDENPKADNLPCEYCDLLALLFEYLYLKEKNELDDFSIKHLYELVYNAKRYVQSYETYERILKRHQNLELCNMTDGEKKRLDDYKNEKELEFLRATLNSLVALSSMDAILQIGDTIHDEQEIKDLIEVLVENENHDRQKILNNRGICSYGYPRLVKEISRCKR